MHYSHVSYINYFKYISYITYVILYFCTRYLLFLVLDKVLCPLLEKYLEMPIRHPKCEKTLDELLEAQIDA